jgi:hypothetical protein
MQTVNGDDDSISLQSNQGFCQDNTGKTRENRDLDGFLAANRALLRHKAALAHTEDWWRPNDLTR